MLKLYPHISIRSLSSSGYSPVVTYAKAVSTRHTDMLKLYPHIKVASKNNNNNYNYNNNNNNNDNDNTSHMLKLHSHIDRYVKGAFTRVRGVFTNCHTH